MKNKASVAGLASDSLVFKYLGLWSLKSQDARPTSVTYQLCDLRQGETFCLIFLVCKMLAANYLMSRVDVRIK